MLRVTWILIFEALLSDIDSESESSDEGAILY